MSRYSKLNKGTSIDNVKPFTNYRNSRENSCTYWFGGDGETLLLIHRSLADKIERLCQD